MKVIEVVFMRKVYSGTMRGWIERIEKTERQILSRYLEKTAL